MRLNHKQPQTQLHPPAQHQEALQVEHEQWRLGPGQSLLAPQGVPHTYRVESADGAHWLTITTRGDFERFMRALARPAEKLAYLHHLGEPTPEAIQLLTETARAHGIEIVGHRFNKQRACQRLLSPHILVSSPSSDPALPPCASAGR